MVYLIHFDRAIGSENPRGKAQHYIGTTENLEQRMKEHKSGQGAAIMRYVSEHGIGWQVVATFEGGRKEERQIKNKHSAKTLCPICRSKS